MAESAAPPRYASVLGLGFGDCGKGLFTDYLCRAWRVHTVVRFNGGAQAGHNVVLPDGTHHTFSQFGAGTFIPGVRTLLAAPVIVHPTALLVENEHLLRCGVADGLARLIVDARCLVVTPYHQAAGRLRETARGPTAHGTCGTGVGETVAHALRHPGEEVRFRDLTKPGRLRDALETARLRLLADLGSVIDGAGDAGAAEARVLADPSMADAWIARIEPLARRLPASSTAEVAIRLQVPGCVLFEGAQGLLLDEWAGFHPHTTWSSTHGRAVDDLAREMELPEAVTHYGVLRPYLTRHGTGPFPTHDPGLDILPEPHNVDGGWQGPFRRGHPDEVLLRYALRHAGRLAGLLVSHLDVFGAGPALSWCTGYAAADGSTMADLPGGPERNLAHQEWLTRILASVRPVYDPETVVDPEGYLDRLVSFSGLPVAFGSFGNTYRDVFDGALRHGKPRSR